MQGVEGVVFFGLSYFIQEYLVRKFYTEFFNQPKERVVSQYKRRIEGYLGKDAITYEHVEALHDLGFLPIEIKALPEGSIVPLKCPMFTIRNTRDEFFWLTNFLETILSCVLWLPCTSATTAREYRKLLNNWARITGSDLTFVPWQGHDFSFRGMGGLEAACMSGAAHLLSFTGTDTIPAIDFLEQYYGADCEKELIGGSVPATEHSVMCMGTEHGEINTFYDLIVEKYPKGIVSIVSDTWDFWKVIDEYLPTLKAEILARDGKVVIRPDSGDPVKVVCGDPDAPEGSSERKGAIQRLWEIFGGTETKTGHKLLDSHIGLIYGDSITLERCADICTELALKGFASTNVVFGIGSYTYQHVTRDTFGFAVKATFGVVDGEPREIFKAPKTDNGGKKSAKGLIAVYGNGPNTPTHFRDGVSWHEEGLGMLKTVYRDGQILVRHTLAEIRERLWITR
jgi:nicotinamide phosphoribosyltransferase